MDLQVKERLVGAAVLVALGVWLIPWLLDGPDADSRPPALLTELNLPAGSELTPVRTETIAIGVAEPSAETALTAEPVTNVEPTTVAVLAPETIASQSQPEELPPATGGSADGEDAIGAQAPAAAEDSVMADAWSVQVGAFGEPANADQLVARLASYGYSAAVSEVRTGGSTIFRVRVRGLQSESEAEAAASSLSARRIPVQVIPPE